MKRKATQTRNEKAASKKQEANKHIVGEVKIPEVIWLGPTGEELKKLPEDKALRFLRMLEAIRHKQEFMPAPKKLNLSKGYAARQLSIQGSPGFRLVYSTDVPGKVFVLYVGKKTAQHTDRQLIETVELRRQAMSK